MSSPLVLLQEDITAKLAAEPYFADISVKSVRRLQIESEVEQKMPHLTEKGGKVGIGVLVGMPTIDVERPNMPGPEGMVQIGVRVQENPTINMSDAGTGKSAEDVAMEVAQLLHLFGIEGALVLYADKNAIEPNTEDEGLVTYDVFLRGKLGQASRDKVVLPTLTEEALTVTLENVTADADIYYTTDESFPAATNDEATLYAGPFAVADGTVIRWAAYKTGMDGSDVGRATVSE